MKIGKVYADSEKTGDRADRNLISMGVIAGDGLLGAVVAAAHDLETASENYGYHGGETAHHLRAVEKREAAWLKLFDVLKQIEVESESGKAL